METYIVMSGRRMGKTQALIDDIYRRIVNGERANILVVFPDLSQVEFFANEWNLQYPHIPRPSYVTIRNTLKIRGRRYKYIYVENVDMIEEGWHDERLHAVRVALDVDGEITLSYTPTTLSLKSHERSIKPEDYMKTRLRKFRRPKPKLDSQ